ncbi:MAG: ribonuclease P protein component [Magnetococcus sp. MYC-9]
MSIPERLPTPVVSAQQGGVGQGRGFPKAVRLLEGAEFRAVTASGRRKGGRFFLLFSLETALSHSRLGLTVSRKVGKAVLRNRIKRQMREFFRCLRAEVDARQTVSLDMVLIARPQAGAASTEALLLDLQKLFSPLVRPP